MSLMKDKFCDFKNFFSQKPEQSFYKRRLLATNPSQNLIPKKNLAGGWKFLLLSLFIHFSLIIFFLILIPPYQDQKEKNYKDIEFGTLKELRKTQLRRKKSTVDELQTATKEFAELPSFTLSMAFISEAEFLAETPVIADSSSLPKQEKAVEPISQKKLLEKKQRVKREESKNAKEGTLEKKTAKENRYTKIPKAPSVISSLESSNLSESDKKYGFVHGEKFNSEESLIYEKQIYDLLSSKHAKLPGFERKELSTTINLVINQNGYIQSLRVKTSSGHRGFDDLVLNTITSEEPLPAPPQHKSFSFEITFHSKE